MAKYHDVVRVRSDLHKFRKGEDPKQRHQRRLDLAVEYKMVISAWCKRNKIGHRRTHSDHHWIFTKGDKSADWWPSSAKLIFNKEYKKGMHVHDIKVLARLLAPFFGVDPLEK